MKIQYTVAVCCILVVGGACAYKLARHFSHAPSANKPRGFRLAIRMASDVDVGSVNSVPKASTVEMLLALPRPNNMPIDGSSAYYRIHRANPVETTVYSVEADVTACRITNDHELRLTIRGASGKTLLVAVPQPSDVDPKSPFYGQIKTVRQMVNDKITPTTSLQHLLLHVHVSGIGFFGRWLTPSNTAGTSAATKAVPYKKEDGNLIQLNPLLSVDWLKGPANKLAPRPAK